MTVFSETDLPVAGTIGAMVITSLAAFGAGVLNYLAGRDRLRYDREKSELEVNVANLQKEVKLCESERERDRLKMAEMDITASQAKVQAAKLEGEVKSLREECERNHAEIDQLRNRMYGAK